MAKINIYGSLWNNLSTRNEKIIAYGSQIDGIHADEGGSSSGDWSKVTWSEGLASGNQYDINRWFLKSIGELQTSFTRVLLFKGVYPFPEDYVPKIGDVWHLNTPATIDGIVYQEGDDIVCVADGDSPKWELLGKNDALKGRGIVTEVTVKRGELGGEILPDAVKVVTKDYDGNTSSGSNIPLAAYGSGGFKAGLLSSTDKQKLNLTSNFAYVGVVPARVDIIGGSGAYYYPWTTPLITNMLKYNINLGGNNYTAPSEYAAGYPRPGYIYKLQGSLALRTSATDTKIFNPGDYVYCCEVKSVKKTSDSTGDWEENGMNYVAYFKKFENFYVEERLDPKNINIAWLEAPYDESDIDSPIPGGGGSGGTTNEWVGGNVTESGDEVFDKVDNPADIIIGGPASEYLTLTAIEGGTLSFSGTGLNYSTDNGVNWKTLNADTGMPIGPGQSVIFKGEYANTTTSIGKFTMNASSRKKSKFNLSGNIMSLLFGDGFVGKTDLTKHNSAFDHLFEGTAVVDASKLVLPATKLSIYCYGRMFYYCSSLTIAPKLPATTLAANCYNSMFYGCTSLTTAPELPATALADSCYYSMFYGCTKLTTAPELPATTLADSCYYNMFYGCTKLTTAPELPATTLADSCYYNMFYNCTSLTTAPELPATTLAANCYNSMFYGCTSLTTAPELPATTLVERCYYNMFKNCTSLTAAPELPATTLAERCYYGMFYGCTSLTAAPELPATTLAPYCYDSMFRDCSKLTAAPVLPATTLAENCYSGMLFGCTSLTTAPELPVTNLAESCYNGMFGGCSSLTAAPELPATTLAPYCYAGMFNGCTSLTTAPELPATTLAQSCYWGMFQGCTSLTTAPELPVTTLANKCYNNMFNGCTSLTTAPELPATTLTEWCYYNMFSGCTSLTTAPVLPATTLVSNCYKEMFKNCSNLNYIKALFTTTPSSSYTRDWVSGVSNTGEFVKNAAATWNVTGTYGIPSGWDVMTVVVDAPAQPLNV